MFGHFKLCVYNCGDQYVFTASVSCEFFFQWRNFFFFSCCSSLLQHEEGMGLIEDNEINNNTLAGVWITTGKNLPADHDQNTMNSQTYEDFQKTKSSVNNRHFLNGNSNKVSVRGGQRTFEELVPRMLWTGRFFNRLLLLTWSFLHSSVHRKYSYIKKQQNTQRKTGTTHQGYLLNFFSHDVHSPGK